MPTQDELLAAFFESTEAQLKSGVSVIQHCVTQLSLEQVWWRPSEDMNSIANLLIHLEGNVRQWMICGLNAQADLRNRQSEFDDRSNRPVDELLRDLEQTVNEAIQCIRSQTADDLVRRRLVQEWDETGFSAIAGSTTHFVGHVQEIVHMTRVLLGDKYQFRFVPKDQA